MDKTLKIVKPHII